MDLRTQRGGLALVMGGHHQCSAPHRLVNGGKALCFRSAVQPGKRLVQHQHIEGMGQRPGHRYPALHPAAERVRHGGKAVRQSQCRQTAPGGLPIAEEGHIFQRRFPRQQPILLKHGGKRRSLRYADGTSAWLFQPQQQPQHGGFAFSRRARQAQPPALRDLQGNIPQYLLLQPIAEGDVFKTDHGAPPFGAGRWLLAAKGRCTPRSPPSGQTPRHS